MKNLEKDLLADKKIIKEAQKIIDNANKSKTSTKNQKDTSLSVQKNKSKKITILVVLLIIAFITLLLSVIFGILTSSSNKIVSGVSVNGIDISNLTKEEALEKLNSQLSSNLQKEITLTRGDYSNTLDTSSIEAHLNLDATVNQAYDIGRSENNIFANNLKVISVYFKKQHILPILSYNSDLLDEKINILNNELPDKVVNSSYKIEDNNLIISNSCNGYRIQSDLLKNNIELAILNNVSILEIPVEEFEAESINIDAIYKEIYKEAVDATYSTNPYEIHKEEEGLDFAISLDEAKQLLSKNQETYAIPLKVTKPSVKVKDLPKEAFPDLLATYSTTYSTANTNRATNIALATKSINSYVLMPNETFSYNTTVGQRTAARGYKEAGVYLNGAVTTGLGGGICQVSSTLYNAVLLSNLEIVERSNHTFEPSYVPAGQDATVSWGAPDFKFKNNRNYAIKIVATTSNGRININIYGLKTNDDYEVKIQSSKIATISYTTEYQDDSSLPMGTTKITQNGSNGCKSQTYKILYKNGIEVSRTLISTDTYNPHNQVILRGTKVIETPSTPTNGATETPNPSETTQNPTPSVTITSEPAA